MISFFLRANTILYEVLIALASSIGMDTEEADYYERILLFRIYKQNNDKRPTKQIAIIYTIHHYKYDILTKNVTSCKV